VTSPFRSSQDVIIRTEAWADATTFYGSVLGLPVVHRSETLMGFETGEFCLYVEQGREHGPVFEFLVPDVQAYRRLRGCCRQGAIVEQTRAAQDLTKVRTLRKCVWKSGVVDCRCAGSRLTR